MLGYMYSCMYLILRYILLLQTTVKTSYTNSLSSAPILYVGHEIYFGNLPSFNSSYRIETLVDTGIFNDQNSIFKNTGLQSQSNTQESSRQNDLFTFSDTDQLQEVQEYRHIKIFILCLFIYKCIFTLCFPHTELKYAFFYQYCQFLSKEKPQLLISFPANTQQAYVTHL